MHKISAGNHISSRMRSLPLLMLIGITAVFFCSSCTRKGSPPTRVTVIGEASLNTQPDAAVMIFSVVTQSPQALEAQQQNAGKSDAVIKAVKDTAGANAEIKTNSYTLQPQNDYRDNKLPKIIGYETRNSLMVTISDLTKVGLVIDAASRAGANSIERVSFILKDNSAASGQVMAEATRQAMTKARAIAQSMGGQVVRLVEEQEQGTTGLQPGEYTYVRASVARQWETPVQAGPIKVNSRVQLIVEVDAHP
ncbi:MAG: SIMPL domain-containing protein [Acidobacteriota bacterium]|nr:SIMPL domain-containing protein [Acidobacteriota bacterium]